MPSPDSAQRDRIYQRFQYLKSFFQERWVEHQLFGLIDRHCHGRHAPVAPPSQESVNAVRDLLAKAETMLDSASFDEIVPVFTDVTIHLKKLSEENIELSERIRPNELRSFIEQNPSFDEENLVYLARFYVSKEPKEADDFDVIDLLVTRLTTNASDNGLIEKRPAEVINKLMTRLLPETQQTEDVEREIDEVVRTLRAKTEQLAAGVFESPQDLHAHPVFDEVRRLKHGLGGKFISAQVLLQIVDYNVVVRNLIKGVYNKELSTVEDQVLQLRVMLRTLERQAERDPKLANDFVAYAREVEDAFGRIRDRGGDDGQPVQYDEMRRSIERALKAYDVASASQASPSERGQLADKQPSAATPPPDDFVIGDEVAGAAVENTADYVAALAALATKDDASKNALAVEVAPLFQSLEPWEIEAFAEDGAPEWACLRTLVALRLKIVRFDAWRRKEVGREAALRVSTAYLLEVEEIENSAQEVINELIKGARLEIAKNVSGTRSRLLTSARELRVFVEEVKMEIAGGTPSAALDLAPSPDVIPEGWGSRARVKEDTTSSRITFPVPRAKAKAKAKVPGRPATKEEAEAARKRRKKVVMFVVSLFAFFGVSLYMVLDDKIEQRYKGRVPEFAEFEVDRFKDILPLSTAKKIRDVVEVVVKPAWAQLGADKRRERVAMLYNVLRPSGVSQLFVFNLDRKMVASCLNGKVAVIQ